MEFGNTVRVELPRVGDLIKETFLQIEIPSVYFNISDIGGTVAVGDPITLATYESNYEIVVAFMQLNIGTYRNAHDSYLAENTTALSMVDSMITYFTTYVGYDGIRSLYDALMDQYHNLTGEYIFASSLSNLYTIALKLKADITAGIVYTKDDVMNILNNALYISNKVQLYFYNLWYTYMQEQEVLTSERLKFAWVEKLGHAMIEYIDVYIGGEKIDRHFGEWLDIWYELTKGKYQEQIYNKMIGNVSTMTTYNNDIKPRYILKIPLRFWFCKLAGLSFPIIALQYNSIYLDIKLRRLEDCSYIQHYVLPGLTNISITDLWEDKGYSLKGSLLIDYVYLDIIERRRFSQSAHEYLIERIQDMTITDIVNSQQSLTLDFNDPCKAIVWIAQKQAYLDNSTGWYKSYWNRYSSTLNSGGNPITQADLELNGKTRFEMFEGAFYNYVQPEKNTNTPPDGVNVMNISLFPEEHQPSSSCNLSKILSPVLNFTIDSSMFQYKLSDIDPSIVPDSPSDETLETSVRILAFAISYNILRIISGMGALAFT